MGTERVGVDYFASSSFRMAGSFILIRDRLARVVIACIFALVTIPLLHLQSPSPQHRPKSDSLLQY